MSCRPEQVTAYVDGALAGAALTDVEAHVAECADCARQGAEERRVRDLVHAMPAVDVPFGLEARVRGTVHAARPRPWRVLLPLAAALVLGIGWLRGNPAIVSFELALDHKHCFGKEQLPAQVWGQDPLQVRAWFTAQGAELPLLPESANGLDLVGGRFCPLADRKVAHLYYGNKERNLSLYVVPGPLRFGREGMRQAGGRMVQLLHVGHTAVALVGDDHEDVSAFQKTFQTTVAALQRRLLPSLTPPKQPDILFVSPMGL